MRHRKKGNLLGRPADQRKALLRSLATELLRHRQILTTVSKAKAVTPEVEKLITLAKRGDLHARRQAEAFVLDGTVTKSLFDEIAPQYKDRSGGYLRIVKAEPRRGDNAPMAYLSLV